MLLATITKKGIRDEIYGSDHNGRSNAHPSGTLLGVACMGLLGHHFSSFFTRIILITIGFQRATVTIIVSSYSNFASSFSSRAFCCSRSFSRLGWSVRRLPYSFRQR